MLYSSTSFSAITNTIIHCCKLDSVECSVVQCMYMYGVNINSGLLMKYKLSLSTHKIYIGCRNMSHIFGKRSMQ